MDGERVTDAVWFLLLRSRFNHLLLKAAAEDLFVCVPQSCSLSMSAVTLADVEHHILKRSEPRGRFTTLSGRTVTVTGLRMTTGSGFAEKVDTSVLSSQTVSVALPGGLSGRLHLYFLSRPLVGGIAAPARLDELSPTQLAALNGFLRLAPDAEAPLADLRAGVRKLARALSVPPTPELVDIWLGGFGRSRREKDKNTTPPTTNNHNNATASRDNDYDEEIDDEPSDLTTCRLATELQNLLTTAAEELLEGDALAAVGDNTPARVTLFRQVIFALQADVASDIALPTLNLLRFAHARELARVSRSLTLSSALPPTALGVKTSFLCELGPAADVLAHISATHCPLGKLQLLVKASDTMRGLLEADLYARGVDLADVDFGADDLLPLLASLLATAWRRGEGTDARKAVLDLPLQLAYIQTCVHPEADLQHSSFGYNLANYEQVLKCESSSHSFLLTLFFLAVSRSLDNVPLLTSFLFPPFLQGAQLQKKSEGMCNNNNNINCTATTSERKPLLVVLLLLPNS